MAKVSLIMLVYKTEQFIEKSLRSALEQTFDDLEIVIVNDASPDNAMAVVERVIRDYPHREPQVKIISHPVNKGSAVARQTGIDNATGEYTIYLDSDDWVEPEMIERLYECAIREDADIVVCDYYAEYLKRRVYCPQIVPLSGKNFARGLLRGDRYLACTLWNKLIRRRMYTDFNIQFTLGVDIGEDLLITVKLSWFANKICSISEAFIHYRMYNPNSLTNVFDRKKIDDIIYGTAELERFAQEQPDWNDYDKDIIYRKLYTLATLLRNIRGHEQIMMVSLYPDITRKHILQARIRPIYRVALCCASLGFFRTANLTYYVVGMMKRILLGYPK
jgi:glycosyltransferase involved in cell wall biosynthesis